MTTSKPPNPEREHTDESLRVEREKVDDALDEKLAAIEEAADAVIVRARERADKVVAAARAKADRRVGASPAAVAPDRVREDRTVERERTAADETTRAERAESADLLATERLETDKGLVTERAKADDALATRDEFLGIVSHDLRNMLNAMTGLAGLIVKTEAREPLEGHQELVSAYAERIQRSGGRMNRLIGDLVDIASIEAGSLAVSPEASDPGVVVTEAVETFKEQAAARAVKLVADIAPGLPVAEIDPARVLQVLVNLIGNAIKFTDSNGRVVVRVSATKSDLEFVVSDTGQGIPNDKLEAIFQRFVQVTKNDRRGIGLGLFISRSIVQGHGGRIWAESTLGKGSTFFFTLPIHHVSRA
ncbi:MAG: sensor histidine kinase [Polyangiales bacterium]